MVAICQIVLIGVLRKTFGFTEASKFLLRSLSSGACLGACTHSIGRLESIPSLQNRRFLFIYLFIIFLFFGVSQASGGKHEASAERESRATGGASLPSRVTRACLFCRLAFLDDPLGEGGVFSIHDMTESSCHDAITGYGLDYAGNTPTCFHLLKSLSPFC